MASDIQGNVRANDPDVGKPVKVGGVFNSSKPTYGDGDRADFQADSRGAQLAVLHASGSTNPLDAARAADGVSGTLILPAAGYLYNGATFDRQRGNVEGTALASAARTATVTSADITNHNARALNLFIDVTAITDTPSVVFTVFAKDGLTGGIVTIISSSAIVGTGFTWLRIGPGLGASSNIRANEFLPRTFSVRATHADSDEITYSVSYSLGV